MTTTQVKPCLQTQLSYDKDEVRELLEYNPKATETSERILAVILQYALDKLDNPKARLAAGVPKFLKTIQGYVSAEKKLEMCLPAFPFKSANKIDKVLGVLPDKAEELALLRLNTMCSQIEELYSPGAKITIISDGLVYNDLLGISDSDTWLYGEAIREMAVNKGFTNIGFSRLRDIGNFDLPDKLEEITYVANATNFRRMLLNKYGNDDIDIDSEIAHKEDTLMTYCGYRRFLESDLQHVFPNSKEKLTKNGFKRNIKYLAKEMLVRGNAFAGAVKEAFPDHLRLSIHHSTGEHKVSISLLNTETGFTTPWHCSVAKMANGEWLSGTKDDFEKDNFELVYEEDRPYYYVEKA